MLGRMNQLIVLKTVLFLMQNQLLLNFVCSRLIFLEIGNDCNDMTGNPGNLIGISKVPSQFMRLKPCGSRTYANRKIPRIKHV